MLLKTQRFICNKTFQIVNAKHKSVVKSSYVLFKEKKARRFNFATKFLVFLICTVVMSLLNTQQFVYSVRLKLKAINCNLLTLINILKNKCKILKRWFNQRNIFSN